MKQNKKLLCVLFSILFLTVPLGITTLSPIGNSTTSIDAAIPADEYDFGNRREPVNVLVYNEYADLSGTGEYANTMAELKAEYGYTFEYENLTDYTLLEGMINDYDVLLLVEQEVGSYAEMDVVAAAWNSFLPGWIDDGGVLICLDYWTDIDTWYAPTARILNTTNLMRTYNHATRTSDPVTITDSFNPLAFGVSAFTAANGAMGFDTPDGDAVFSSLGLTVVAHRYFGIGHIVMLGFDMFNLEVNQRIILANAVRLSRLAVFDNSHNQFWDPWSGYNEFATYIQENYGFAIATMNTWDESIISASEVLVVGATNVGPVYNTNEINFIADFVASGKGLFTMTDIWWYGNSTDPILAEFGFARNQTAAFASDSDDHEGEPNQPVFASDNIANHSATISTSSVQMFGPTALTSIPADATPLIWTDSDGTASWSAGGDASGLAVAASLHYGAGRIVVVSDGDFLTDYDNDATPDASLDFYDRSNEEFASSVMIWLSAAGIPEKQVVFDQSHSPVWSISGGQLIGCARFLSFNGFNVRWTNHFPEDLLAESDVLVLVDGSSNHTAQETAVIVDFVSQGGGLFLMADWGTYGSEVAAIGREFGYDYSTSSYIEETGEDLLVGDSYNVYDGANIGTHPIMEGVSRIEIDRGGAFTAIGSGTPLLLTDTDGSATWSTGGNASGVSLMAATEYNMGRVIQTSDINFYDIYGDTDSDGYGMLYDSDNDVFTANAFYWLVENRAPTVEVVFPNGGEVLNGTITVSWTAVDFDSDPLIYNVFFSDNNGSDWTLLAADLHAQEYAWNTTQHDDGNSYMILVEVSDGQLGDQDVSDDPFELDNFVGGEPGLPIDPLLLAIIGAGVVVVLLILVILSKKKGGGKKK